MSAWPGGDSLDLGFLDSFGDAAVVADGAGDCAYLNPAAELLLGAGSAELVGRPVAELVATEAGRTELTSGCECVRRGTAWRGELEVLGPAGSTVMVEARCSPLRAAGSVVGLLLMLQALHDHGPATAAARANTDRIASLAKVAAELTVADDLETVTQVVTSEAAQVVGATVGSLSLLEGPDTLVLAGLHGGRHGAAQRWTRYSTAAPTPASAVARTGEPLMLVGRDVITARYPDLELAADGERSMVVLPLSITGRTIGVMSWSFPGRRRLEPVEMAFYGVLADTCAQAVERIRARQESDRQAARLRFLADATTQLSESLDYQKTLSDVARMAVPEFADWCAIDLVEDGRLHRLAVEHIDPQKIALAIELQEHYPARPQDGGAWTVIRTGEPLLVPEVTDDMVAPTAQDDEHRRLLLELGLRSVLLVPLMARGSVLGVMSWVMAESGRRYQESDLAFAADLARRAAIAIDNSHLHTETLEAALRLQHAVLPQLPDSVPGWGVSSCYSPAGRTEVGGDFFDVVPLDHDRIAVFIGDVMGRGVKAAAAMAQMRAAVRAYIADDPDPQVVLRKLDRLFTTYDLDQLVTLVYLLCDGATVRMVNAGHPPPVLLRATGAAEALTVEPGPPLGTDGVQRAPLAFTMAEGDLFVGYTDGLIERREEAIDAGLQRLVDTAPMLLYGPLDRQLDHLVVSVRDHTREDDVAALVLRRAATTAGQEAVADPRT